MFFTNCKKELQNIYILFFLSVSKIKIKREVFKVSFSKF